MGLLALAGMISGAGEGAGKAASQAMTYLSTSALQEQRERMELRRMQLMEANNAAREQRGYQHAETMQANQQAFARGTQQEAFGQSQLAAELAVRRGEDTAKRERDRQRNPDEIAADAAAERNKFAAGKDTREAKRDEDTQTEITRTELLGSSPTYLEAQKNLVAAKESPSQKADAALKNFQLEASKEAKRYQDDYVKAVESGDEKKIASAKQAYEAFAQKPWEADKVDAVHAAAGLKEAGIEITRLQGMMKDAMPGSPEALALQRRLQNAEAAHEAYDIRLRQLTGTKQKPATGTIKIVDPLATPPGPDSMMAKKEATPAPGADEYLAQKRQEAQERADALKRSTQQAGQAAMDAERPGAAIASAPVDDPAQPPVPPATAKMERQQPGRMQQPGEASEPTGMLAAIQPPPPAPPQTAALPRELPRAAAPSGDVAAPPRPIQEPRYLDQDTGGPSAPVEDPMTAFATDRPANVPRELPRAEPRGLIAAAKPPMEEPGMTDPDGPPVESGETPGTPGLKPAASPIRRPLTEKDLQDSLTVDQKEAIADMRKRVRSNGIKVQPATEQQLRSLLIKIYGPILQQSGYTPAEMVDNINGLMDTLLPERKHRKDRK